MRSFEVAVILAAAGALAQGTGVEHNALVVDDSPPDARYIATFEGVITGRVLAGSDAFGIGVTFHISVTGLSETAGPYNYHLHEFPVPSDGSCAGTGGHLDPFGRTQEPACESDWPETCEVGDLSGKHGTLEGASDDYSFHDLFTSLNPANDAFFGDKSIVIHNANGDRVACASFTPVPKPSTGEEPVEVTPEEPAPEEPTPEEPAPEEPAPEEPAPEEPAPEEPAPETPVDEDDECEADPVEEPAPEEPAPETPVDEDDECEADPVEETPVEEPGNGEVVPEEPAEGGELVPEEPAEGEVVPEEPEEGEVVPEEPEEGEVTPEKPVIIVVGPIEGDDGEDGMELGP